MFNAILSENDASRATSVVKALLTHRFPGALTGGIAIAAHLRARGRSSGRRPLNDLDFVVESFASIPESIADRFLLNHVHPSAPEGKTLMQLIDPDLRVRVDLFRAFGATLSRSGPLDADTEPLAVVGLEDLVARTTSHVYAHLREGRAIEAKYARNFLDLAGCGSRRALEEAWRDHRQDIEDSFLDASRQAHRLLALHPELIVEEKYSVVVAPCDRCKDSGPFRCASPERVVEILGYW